MFSSWHLLPLLISFACLTVAVARTIVVGTVDVNSEDISEGEHDFEDEVKLTEESEAVIQDKSEDDIVIKVRVLFDLFGIGRLHRVLDLARGEFGCLVGDAQLVQSFGQRKIISGPKILCVG